jgi:hypothetical protein
MSKPKAADPKVESVAIKPPNFKTAVIAIKGVSPYVQNAFSVKMRDAYRAKQAEGGVSKTKRAREPKDFDSLCKEALHTSKEGWHGIPAPAFRDAAISACRLVGFKMTHAKLSLFILPDGFDAVHGTPLVRIFGKWRQHEAIVRNETGVIDMRARPMWEDWEAKVKVRWDADQFNATDVVNLFVRVGMQVGVGEGRADSPNSNGQGWGHFEVAA